MKDEIFIMGKIDFMKAFYSRTGFTVHNSDTNPPPHTPVSYGSLFFALQSNDLFIKLTRGNGNTVLYLNEYYKICPIVSEIECNTVWKIIKCKLSGFSKPM